MALPHDPIAEKAGLHPNWRKLGLGHIRQVRAFMRDRSVRGDAGQGEARSVIKRAQAELARTRRRYLDAAA